MTRPIVLRPEAQAEFNEASDWYEQQRLGLGVDFVRCVQHALDLIEELPQMYAQVFEDVRQAPVRRFPYSVLYRVETDQIVVLAVFHGRRDPRI
ncbi:MAG TPA: type II toxin-antitoxin system RelE/ParE family toxin, partial [Planctomycetaceae bacterium]|nr:type II toxin-antitoxin system RelE/ParE family toxin [Planctomycetaceae bacterium]